jgi:hypothetical protein
MSTLEMRVEPRIIQLSSTEDALKVVLADGREVLGSREVEDGAHTTANGMG